MKSSIYKASLLTAVLAVIVSCSDSFLDKTPDERTEIDSEENVISLLVSAYPFVCPAWVCELSSDNLTDNQSPHLPTSPNDKQVSAHYNFSHYSLWDNELFRFDPAENATYADTDSPGMCWEYYYNSIATANAALEGVETVLANGGEMSDKLSAAKGEALLIRAYSHFMLVNIFSKAYKNAEDSKNDIGVPYVTEVETVVSKEYDRGNVADVYEKIGEDLEAGLELISDINFDTAPKYHFNTNAANAFAARYYLFTRQYEKVIEYADNVLGTDSSRVQAMVLDYSEFDDCSSMDDFGNVWQDPDQANNLMLTTTYSVLQRRMFGYRYSYSGTTAREALMIGTSNPLWSGYICPLQSLVNGSLFASSAKDYGFISSKIAEQFEYTDKIQGIGYAHIIYRAFTANLLLLERAEAKIMLGKYDEGAEDLRLYWNCALNSFSEDSYTAYVTGGYAKIMTNSVFTSYYNDSSNANCFDDWDFTQLMSSDFIVPAEAVPYMNCLNEFRRYETSYEGMRFFDIKRWGLDLSHTVGLAEEVITVGYDDDERAIEVPWETLSAGLESSRSTYYNEETDATLDGQSLRASTSSASEATK